MSASAALLRDAKQAALAAGLDAVGSTTVAEFPAVRRSLEERVRDGHHAGMSFTFKNPRRSTEPTRLLRNAASMLVGAKAYLEPTPPKPSSAVASVARYARRDHYQELRVALEAGAEVLRSAGHRAHVVADQNGLVDRAAAYRAGIGWWGRNSNLLLPGLGSWFVLGSVVTDAVLPPVDAPVEDGCRSCTRCIDGCPTGAIVAEGVIDARRCLAWLVQSSGVFPRQYRIALGDRLYGCDDCQDVCPPGRRALGAAEDTGTDAGTEPATDLGPRLDAWVDVLEVLALTDDELLDRFGRWYIPRRQPRYLRRNALVILGNIGDGDDPTHRAVIEAFATGDDALLRAHAVWAAARLGFHDVVSARREDPSAIVRAEVALAPAVPPSAGATSTTTVSLR